MPEKIRRLVYLDAVVIENGETVLSTMPLGSQEVLRTLVAATGGHAVPARQIPRCSVSPIEMTSIGRKGNSLRTPWSTWSDTVTLTGPAGAGLPRHYIDFTEPAFPDIQASKQRVLNNSREWQLDRINTGHDGMISASPSSRQADLVLRPLTRSAAKLSTIQIGRHSKCSAKTLPHNLLRVGSDTTPRSESAHLRSFSSYRGMRDEAAWTHAEASATSEPQVATTFVNIDRTLEVAGFSFRDVVQIRIFVRDIAAATSNYDVVPRCPRNLPMLTSQLDG